MNVLASRLEWAAVAVLTIVVLAIAGAPPEQAPGYVGGYVLGAFIAAFLVVFVASQLYRRLA